MWRRTMMGAAAKRIVSGFALTAPILAIFAGAAARRWHDTQYPEPPIPRLQLQEERQRDLKAYHGWNEQGWNYFLIGFGIPYGLGLACCVLIVASRVSSQDDAPTFSAIAVFW